MSLPFLLKYFENSQAYASKHIQAYNVLDVGPTLYKQYVQMFRVYWVGLHCFNATVYDL